MTDDTPTPPAPPTAIPPERVRIDPPPPPKKLDALPVLYLVGFVILAASLIYLWKHPVLPRNAALEVARMDTLREQVNAIQGRVDQLETKPVPAAPNLAPLEAQVAELQRRPFTPPVDLAPIVARIATIEARSPPPAPPPPVDLKPIEARIAALEGKPPVDLAPISSRVAALEAKPPVDLGPLQQQIASAGKTEHDDLAALNKRLDAMEAQASQTADRLGAVASKAQQAGRLQAAAAALDAGQRLGDIQGAPPALARFAHDNPPTEAGLRLGFDKAADAAHHASQPALTDGQPLLSRMWTRAQQSVTVRQGDNVLVGDPIAGVIASARQSLDAGDLAGAVKTLDGLSGPAKDAMADWIAEARSLLDARAAIGELAGRG